MEPPPTPQSAGSSSAVALPPANTDTPETKKRARQPRNSACSACAGLKMKCVREVEGGPCERCTRMRVECLPAIPKPRKRREGDFVVSHESGSSSARDAESPDVRHYSTYATPVPKPSEQTASASRPAATSRGDLHHKDSRSFSAILAQGLGLNASATPSSDLLQGIDAHAVVNACTVFRQYSSHFPFTSIPLHVDGVSMASQRPVTVLAVSTVVSAADRDRQERLSHAFRLSLAAKVMVDGEHSVDILAGLLIYLAWHHHYMTRQQVYQHLCLLAGMTTDLGLYDEPPRTKTNDRTAALELDRCFVGTYFLCSLLPVFAFNKLSPMKWTDRLRTCAENILRAGESQSDMAVPSLLELAAAVDDFQTVLRTEPQAPASRQHSELQAKAASQRLRALKRDHSLLAGNTVLSACSIDAQHKQIRSSDTPDPSLLIQCACSVKEHFDDLVSRSPIFLHQATIVDWALTLHTAVSMFQLSKQASTATGWEHGALTTMLQPEQTLKRLLNHMAAAPANDSLMLKHDGLLHWLHQFVQNSNESVLSDSPHDVPRKPDLSEGRFRPVNSDTMSLANLPLPYQRPEQAMKAKNLGVLDQDFWRLSTQRG